MTLINLLFYDSVLLLLSRPILSSVTYNKASSRRQPTHITKVIIITHPVSVTPNLTTYLERRGITQHGALSPFACSLLFGRERRSKLIKGDLIKA